MAVAQVIASRSVCVLRQVGAVVVSEDNRHQTVGYNGPPALFQSAHQDVLRARGDQPCTSYCPQSSVSPGADQALLKPVCVSIHAEVNALMQSSRTLRLNGTLYVTAPPCWKCALAVINSGVARLVCPMWEAHREVEKAHILDMITACPGFRWKSWIF